MLFWGWVRGNPGQGQVFATLGSNPGGPTATHTSGNLDSAGDAHLALGVNEPPGPSILWVARIDEACMIVPNFTVLP